MTRRQRYLSQALANIGTVEGATQKQRKIYGGLCHAFPVLVRTNGLCQTLAFVEEKSNSSNADRAAAYQFLRAHVAAALGTGDGVLDAVRTAELGEYLRYTRTVLEAWVYYKRFAVSMLGVQAGEGEDDEQ